MSRLQEHLDRMVRTTLFVLPLLLTQMHRWDGSQIYGSSEAKTKELRDQHEDGKLLLETRGAEETFLPRDTEGNPKTGFSDNWWTGMELLHTLFALEHNAICDKIRGAHPDWTG
jgi:hypothetical protein